MKRPNVLYFEDDRLCLLNGGKTDATGNYIFSRQLVKYVGQCLLLCVFAKNVGNQTSALLINVCKVGGDGRTAWERRRGKKFKRQLPEIGECVWFLKALSEGKDKLDTRWKMECSQE